jgi:uncharacterized membrane protein
MLSQNRMGARKRSQFQTYFYILLVTLKEFQEVRMTMSQHRTKIM